MLEPWWNQAYTTLALSLSISAYLTRNHLLTILGDTNSRLINDYTMFIPFQGVLLGGRGVNQ